MTRNANLPPPRRAALKVTNVNIIEELKITPRENKKIPVLSLLSFLCSLTITVVLCRGVLQPLSASEGHGHTEVPIAAGGLKCF